jgi:acetolactate synthase-1/2/3 large subunit
MSIGMKVAAPHRPCLVIEGDGSLMPCLPELETIVRHGLSIVILVINDEGYGAEMYKMRAHGFDPSLAMWASPDFVAIARAMGGDGRIVTNEDDVHAAVKKGFEAGGLFVVDARVSRSIVNDRYGKLFFGRPNTAPLLRPTARL